MTAIAAIADGENIWIGGDSAMVDEYNFNLYDITFEKVFIVGDFIFGSCGHSRNDNVLRYGFKPPVKLENETDEHYMYNVSKAIKDLFKDEGLSIVENNLEELLGLFIVGYNGKLFLIDEGFGITTLRNNFMSIGCGSGFCLGSLETTEEFELTPEDRILIALECAEKFSAAVRGPFTIISTEE